LPSGQYRAEGRWTEAFLRDMVRESIRIYYGDIEIARLSLLDVACLVVF